jgi:Uma2 family endonuclease
MSTATPLSSTIYQDIAAGLAHPVGLTVDAYDFMIEHHLLDEDTTTELIDGVIVKKDRSAVGEDPMSVGDRHRAVVLRLAALDAQFRAHNCFLQTQQPIVLPPDNEPEPDASIIRGVLEASTTKPRAAEVLCVVEVADSSLRRDLGPKLRAYAGAAIPQYIVVDLQHDLVLVHTLPAGASYGNVLQLRRGQPVSMFVNAGAALTVAVDLLLP